MKREILVGVLVVVVGILLLSPSYVRAEPCEADTNCDEKVDLTDLVTLKNEFLSPDCGPCENCPSGQIDCGDKCIDPMTDEDYCGANSECMGGTTCGSGEICVSGVCELNCPPGFTNCAGDCVDTDTDTNHCGSCPHVCFVNEICVDGDCVANYAASVPKTGQTVSYATGDDGELVKGVEWPNPRFTDNLDGTITDNLSGLIWLKDAACFGKKIWNDALSDSNGLANGDCGLSDGSSVGDWRLPNINELQSLIHRGYNAPALPDTAGTGKWSNGDPFNNVQSFYYWSSTTRPNSSAFAWFVYMGYGIEDFHEKTNENYVWPVRGGPE